MKTLHRGAPRLVQRLATAIVAVAALLALAPGAGADDLPSVRSFYRCFDDESRTCIWFNGLLGVGSGRGVSVLATEAQDGTLAATVVVLDCVLEAWDAEDVPGLDEPSWWWTRLNASGLDTAGQRHYISVYHEFEGEQYLQTAKVGTDPADETMCESPDADADSPPQEIYGDGVDEPLRRFGYSIQSN